MKNPGSGYPGSQLFPHCSNFFRNQHCKHLKFLQKTNFQAVSAIQYQDEAIKDAFVNDFN